MINETITKLIKYAEVHLSLNKEDEIYFRNYLYFTLNITKPLEVDVDFDATSLDVPDIIREELKDYCLNELSLDEKEADKKVCQIFGTLTPRPSEVNKKFWELYKESPEKATDYFFDLCIKNDYVQKTKIDQNIIYEGVKDNHDLVVTINLSKPEKNNKEIAKARGKVVDNYPSCVICLENEGCYGSALTVPRNNLRIIPLTLNGEEWGMQYSPYGYYQEHCIVIKKPHEPMMVNRENIAALFDFVDLFPHYFIGANAGIPIVGGSILGHEHFQGGKYEMPLMKAKTLQKLDINNDKVQGFLLDWPSFAVKFEADNKEDILNTTMNFIGIWHEYNDPSVNIIAYDPVEHNACTTIVSKKNGKYQSYVIPRNNLTTDECPDGVYHVRKENLPIKSEGIGLIEAMGLFILPPRLKRQLSAIEAIKENPQSKASVYEASPDIAEFERFINMLINNEYKDREDLLMSVCDQILEDISVFKKDEKGLEAQAKFLKQIKNI